MNTKERWIEQIEMTGSIHRKSAATRDVARTLVMGRLNLSEFTWLLSCAIVTDCYSFKCSKALSFGYLYVVGSGELIMRLVEQNEL